MPELTVPRISLGQFPTPLEFASNLSKQLGVRLWIKRDDLTGFALGGNKVRKLEFLFGEALEKRTTCIVAAGNAHSNHLRLTTAAARKLGLRIRTVMYGERPDAETGNFRLLTLLEPEMEFTHSSDRKSADEVGQRAAEELRVAGEQVYFIPRGGGTKTGSLGYFHFVPELEAQREQAGIDFDHVIVPTGSCGTLAGVWAGWMENRCRGKLWGISVSRSRQECETVTYTLARDLSSRVSPQAFGSAQIEITDRFLGPAYGQAAPETFAVIRQAAQREGIFLDPVFTGKAMFGLTELIRTGLITKGQTVLFLHTGGHPSLLK